MKISANFDAREWVSRAIWNEFGPNSTWFINPKMVAIAEFYKEFFRTYYQAKEPGKVKEVIIVINNWHTGGDRQYSGYREPACTVGASHGQHRVINAFDSKIYILYNDGTKKEVDYKEIHQVIQENEALFLSKGVTTVESVEIATNWLHTDCRWILNQTKIKIVKP